MQAARQCPTTVGQSTLAVYADDRCPESGATLEYHHPVRIVFSNGRVWPDPLGRLERPGRQACRLEELERPGCVTRKWRIWFRSFSCSRTTIPQWQGDVADFLSRAIPGPIANIGLRFNPARLLASRAGHRE